MKRILMTAALAAIVAGCATVREPAPSVETVQPKASAESNPYSDYGRGMASAPKTPMAVEWHNRAAAELERETSVEALKRVVRLPATADGLLAQVKPAYTTDPMVMTRIAAVSQLVMCPKWDKAPAARQLWTSALLGAAERATDDYRKLFFLDQLRWCGKPAQADRVRAIGARSGSKAVGEFASVVAAELAGAVK